jgi:hypothetical protein
VRKYAATNKVLFTKPTPHGWDIVKVKSDSNPTRTYTVDMTNGRCSCPAWIFQKGGDRNPCKHLKKLGFKKLMDTTAQSINIPDAPSKSQVKQKVKVAE